MKKIFTLLFVIITIFSLTSLAQPGTICNAAFTFSVNGSNNAVQFASANTNTAALLQHQWIFGDGSTGTIANPLHIYTPGTYHVIHMVSYRSPNDSNVVSCIDSADAMVIIAELPVCNIRSNFSVVRDSIQTNKFYFNNLSTGTNPNTVSRWLFGDGSVSYETNPTHVFQAAGVYTVCLAVMNDSLCTNDTCKPVQVTLATTCNLQPYFISQVDSGNHLQVHFYNQGTPLVATDSVTWTFGDGSISHDANPTHTYFQGGSYNVCLIVKRSTPGSAPCVREFCQAITLISTPPPCNIHAGFTFATDSIHTNTVYFTGTTTDTVPWNIFHWTFGDGTSSTDIHPTHTYANSGAYTVCLSITRADSSCSDDTCMVVQVQVPVSNCNLQAYFTNQADSANNFLVHFFNQTGGFLPGDSLQWSFGDGAIAATANPSHTYNQPGIYNVCLMVKRFTAGAVPCVREYCKTITIQQSTVCNLVAGFTVSRDSIPGTANNYVFVNTSTPWNSVDSSFWNFGDGSPVAVGNGPVTHTYTASGTYVVCLKVKKILAGTTQVLCERQSCQTIVVTTVPVNCNLAARFNWHADSANNRKIYFTNITVAAQPSNAVASWTFGDGTGSSSWNPDHVYTQPGQYTVCLKITINGTNCFSDSCGVINVIGNPVDSCLTRPQFVSNADSVNKRRIYFSNTTLSVTSGATAHWSFGDGSSSNDWNAVHVYNAPGLYAVCLTVSTANNCTRTICDSVLVQGNPVPPVNCDNIQLAYVYRRDAYMPNKLFFFATSNRPILQQQWKFTKLTDNSTITVNENDPVHVFGDTGVYQVCLRAGYWGGCVKEYCHTVTINRTNVPSQCIVHAYPNPAHSTVSVNLQLNQSSIITASVFNAQNILLRQYSQQGITGNNLVTLNVQTLVPGFYTIRLMYGGKVCYTRFQKY